MEVDSVASGLLERLLAVRERFHRWFWPHEDDSSSLRKRAHLLIDALLGALLYLSAMTAGVTLLGGSAYEAYALKALEAAMLMLSLMVLRVFGSVRTAVGVAAWPSLLLITYFSSVGGYLGAPSTVLLVILPALVMLFDLTTGVIMLGGVLASLVVLLVGELTDPTPVVLESPVVMVHLATLAAVTVGAFIASWLYGRISNEVRTQLEHTDRLASLGTLTAGIAHEINNPLAVISLSLGVLEEEESTADDRDLALREIRDALDRVGHIVSDMRVYSRLEPDVTGHHTRVHAACRKALRMARARAGRSVPIDVDIREDPWVSIAEGRLVQVLVNLLVNAVQAVESQEEPRVRLEVRLEGERVRLRVMDNGPGWPLDPPERLLEPFRTTRGAGDGTGLGLHIVRTFVTTAGGLLRLDNGPDGGALVDVLVPQRPPPPAIQPSESVPTADERLIVLVIDDDRLVGRAVGRALRMHQVELCTSGEDGLRRLDQAPLPDVVLLDLTMPGISGAEVYAHLLEHHPELERHTAFLTAGAVTEDMRRFLSGVDRPVLLKPARADALAELVRELGTAST